MQTCTLAVDIGASSGRHIAGTVQNGKITLQEVYRFENGVHRENGHLCWDIDTLAKEVVNGLKAAHDAGFAPATIGIDTWAVDFVLLDADNKRIGDAVAYRDERTEGIREALEKEYGLTFADHYARTGIQYQPFNTVYQLMALKKEHPEQLAAAKTFLMVPDYLNYLLCGVPANEYTNASTTALVGADSRDWDDALIEKLGLPRGIFQPIKTAGTVLGHLTPEMQKAVGFDAEVILPATHDTGSAFLAVPARDEYAAYLSSGTWSLLGVENAAAITGPDSCAANFTNEGGYEYRYRYLKNIMGLWMIQSVRRELGEKTGIRPSFPELIAAAKEAADFPSCRRPRHRALAQPMVSPSGRRWVRMTKLSCSRTNAQNSALVIGLFRLPRSLLPLELLEQVEHVRAVFERIVEREDELRRVAQLQPAAELAPQPAARRLQPADRILRPCLLEHADIDFTVAQIRRGIHARDGDHGLHPRVLERADQLRQLPLDLLIDPADSIGSHRPSLQKPGRSAPCGADHAIVTP